MRRFDLPLIAMGWLDAERPADRAAVASRLALRWAAKRPQTQPLRRA